MDEELEYLRWFFSEADFGPSDGDVRLWMEEKYTAKTGRAVPESYKYE